jgi:glycosyltransferase involved in cell wall biosynthesis
MGSQERVQEMAKVAEPRSFRYNRVFLYASLQFCGHIEHYFVLETQDLLVFFVQPRIGPHTNIVRRYHAGQLLEERTVKSSQPLFLYYFLWYVNHIRELFKFSRRGMKTLVLGGHPVVFIGMSLYRRLRPLVYAYWIGDFFPSKHPIIRCFEWLKKRIHDRVDFVFYLSNAINKAMNGELSNVPCRKTVMWGVNPFPIGPRGERVPFNLLFVGLIRPGQGLELLLQFMSEHRDYKLSVIGVCPEEYHAILKATINRLGLQETVFFPNRFYSEEELLAVAKRSHVGIALYDTSADNFTHYADPGKVKAYAEMNLPVLMTRISDIVPYVERFCSGEVIDRIDQAGEALERIRQNYPRYQEGVAKFNAHFAYQPYYQQSFQAFEECWP